MAVASDVVRAEPHRATIPPKPARLASLDVFRGITIALMILVNNPGSWSHIYPPLEHAPWNGWTPTDLVFPFFLFIVGVAMTFSFARRIQEGQSKVDLLRKVMLRGLGIFGVGFFMALSSRFDLSTVRIPGVLQRIGVVYMLAGTLYVLTSHRAQVVISALLLAGYWVAMKLIPVPGYGPGVLEPDGNLAQFVDYLVLHGHTWKPAWDPEGIMSTFPAIVTCLLGVFAGRLLRSEKSHTEKALAMFLWGSAGIVAGVIVDIWFPINKNLWSSSYVLFMAGMALWCLALCYWLVDMKGWKSWAWPFIVYGSNALTVFFLSGMMARYLIRWHIGDVSAQTYIYEQWFASWAGPLNGSLFYAITYILFWLAIMTVFYRKKWFIRL